MTRRRHRDTGWRPPDWARRDLDDEIEEDRVRTLLDAEDDLTRQPREPADWRADRARRAPHLYEED